MNRMDDTINRTEAIDILTRMSTNHFYGHREQEAFKLGAEALSAVRHGRWVKGDEMADYPRVPYKPWETYCSCCGEIKEQSNDNFCGNCGAKMDEVEDNG